MYHTKPTAAYPPILRYYLLHHLRDEKLHRSTSSSFRPSTCISIWNTSVGALRVHSWIESQHSAKLQLRTIIADIYADDLSCFSFGDTAILSRFILLWPRNHSISGTRVTQHEKIELYESHGFICFTDSDYIRVTAMLGIQPQ
jgi:hypothetical protein